MKNTIKEVASTFDNDNYISKNEDGTFTVFTGSESSTFSTEEEAVAEWLELSNDWEQGYYADSLHGTIHATLTDKAQKAYDETSPLNIIERRLDCEYVYDLDGFIVANDLSEDELNETLESLLEDGE